MSLQINQKKEAFLASGGPFGSAGLAVPVAGVTSINPARGSTEVQSEISSPEPYAPVVGLPPAYPVREHPVSTVCTSGVPLCTVSGLPGTAYHITASETGLFQNPCISLSHTPPSAALGAPFAGVSPIYTDQTNLNCAAMSVHSGITPKQLSPIEYESRSRLIIFRVGAAGPINLRPVFNTPYPKKDEAHSSSSQFIRLRLVDFLGKGGSVPYSRRPFSNAHAGGIYNAHDATNKDGLALESGRNRLDHGFDICNPGRPFFDKTPDYAGYSSSNPIASEDRIATKDGVGVRRHNTSVPVITAGTGSTWENQRDSSNNPSQCSFYSLLKPETDAVRFRFSCYPKRSSAAMCADYTCFPAGSRRQAPFLSLPTPHDGARHDFPVRCKSASLTQICSPGRFRAGLRRVRSLMRTVGRGPVFDNSPSKSGAVKPGFF